ncbi:MAG: FliM/FliN family flagellar motor switch protein [Phycisphaerae bacterium]
MTPATDKPAGHRGVRLEFGRQWLGAETLARLGPDSVIELDVSADADVDVYADGRLSARGRAVVIDGKLCVGVREVFDDASSCAATGQP